MLTKLIPPQYRWLAWLALALRPLADPLAHLTVPLSTGFALDGLNRVHDGVDLGLSRCETSALLSI